VCVFNAWQILDERRSDQSCLDYLLLDYPLLDDRLLDRMLPDYLLPNYMRAGAETPISSSPFFSTCRVASSSARRAVFSAVSSTSTRSAL
jgi:hypothetical protein